MAVNATDDVRGMFCAANANRSPVAIDYANSIVIICFKKLPRRRAVLCHGLITQELPLVLIGRVATKIAMACKISGVVLCLPSSKLAKAECETLHCLAKSGCEMPIQARIART